MVKTNTCVVVDSDIGNVFSVIQALRRCGVEPVLTANPDQIRKAGRVILPGVGAFKNGMEELKRKNLIEPLIEFTKKGNPILGICLGMQMFGSQSSEFGEHQGLNLIPGKTAEIPRWKRDGTNLKVPSIGWREINVNKKLNADTSILTDVPKRNAYYFVHSYQFHTDIEDDVLATYDYDGVEITAAIRRDNITGLQFHPEKSSGFGLLVLSAFVSK